MTTKSEGRLNQYATNILLGNTAGDYIHDKVLPILRVKKDHDSIASITDDRMRIYESRRDPSDTSLHRINFNMGPDQTYQIGYYDNSIEVPHLIAANIDAPYDPNTMGAIQLQDMANIGLEKSISDLMSDETVLTQNAEPTATNKWGNAVSNPFTQFDVGIRTIRKAKGKRPNRMVVGSDVIDALKQHPLFRERVNVNTKVFSEEDIIEIIRGYTKIKTILVGETSYVDSAPGQTVTKADVWGNIMTMYWVPELPSIMTPSFGYRIVKSSGSVPALGGGQGIGSTFSVKTWEEPIAKKSTVNEISWNHQDKILDTDAAFLFYNVL